MGPCQTAATAINSTLRQPVSTPVLRSRQDRETGQFLGLSEWTIVLHLEKAKRRFGVNSKQLMLARSVALKLGPQGDYT